MPDNPTRATWGFKCAGSLATDPTIPSAKGIPLALAPEILKAEQDRLREALRELEAEQRSLESKLKTLRQREMKTKREIEALGILLDVGVLDAGKDRAESAENPEVDKP